MKKHYLITLIFLLFFFQKIQAQDYEFFSGKKGDYASGPILLNKDSILFWSIGNANFLSDFAIKIYNSNKYLHEIKYKFSTIPNRYFRVDQGVILNDTTIILGGATNIVDNQGDCFIIILDACLKPKKMVVFNEQKDANIINGITKLDDKRVILNLGSIGVNSLNSFVPYNIETGELEMNKRITIETDEGVNLVVDDMVYYYGSAYRNKNLSNSWKYLKTHMAKYDTTGNLFWEKLYVLDDDSNYYDGRDLTSLKNPHEFIAIMNDKQPDIIEKDDGIGVRVVQIDSAFNIVWDKIISDTTKVEVGNRIIKINENRFLIAGSYYPILEDFDIFCGKIFLIDSNGVVLATKELKCGNPQTESFQLFLNVKMVLTPDGGVLVAGNYFNGQENDAYLVKLKPDLSIAQQKPDNRVYYNACGEQWEDITYELPTPEIIVLSKDFFTRTPAPVYSVGPNKSLASIEKTKTGEAKAIIYPNPTSAFLVFYSEDFQKINVVDFEIYNSIGQLVLSKKQVEITQGKFTIDVQELVAGNYHLKVSGKDNSVNFKFVVE